MVKLTYQLILMRHEWYCWSVNSCFVDGNTVVHAVLCTGMCFGVYVFVTFLVESTTIVSTAAAVVKSVCTRKKIVLKNSRLSFERGLRAHGTIKYQFTRRMSWLPPRRSQFFAISLLIAILFFCRRVTARRLSSIWAWFGLVACLLNIRTGQAPPVYVFNLRMMYTVRA